jgi:ribosomal protein L11 methyltransferase
MSYLQIDIKVNSGSEREILIAELISIGFESFEEEDDLLKAFIIESSFNKSSFDALMEFEGKVYDVKHIQEKNWNEEWEKNIEPVVIGKFCSVRASFHEPNKNTAYEIVINPKMSFGTGHHATTYLMLELMQEMDIKNATVFDFGTGTGILAIMAEILGAKEVTAIDVDEWSIENARENLEINNCHKVSLRQSDNIPTDKSFRIILANINRNVIQTSLPAMCKILEARGEILLSGLLDADFSIINDEATKLGLHLQRKGEKSGWIALRFANQS